MKINLLVRFIVIIAVAVISSLIAYNFRPQLGIDLAGGTSLLYELDMSKAPAGSGSDLAAQVIAVLKKRVDPYGSKNMIWRVVEGKRIQIQMPYPSQQVLDARKARDKAEKDLKEIQWKQSELAATASQAAASDAPAKRTELLEKFIAAHMVDARQQKDAQKEALAKLEALADASKKLEAAKAKLAGIKPADWPVKDIQARQAADAEYSAALQGAMSLSVDLNYLTNLMKNADTFENREAQTELTDLPSKYPLQKDRVEALIAAHKSEVKLSGGGVDSPEELQRLVTHAGVLDFRIAVLPTEIGQDLQEAVQSLQNRGPEQQVRANGTVARWFEIEPNGRENLTRGGYVTAMWAHEPYILCYDDHDHTLTHTDPKRQPWRVSARNPGRDPGGNLYLPFNLDAVGGNYMGDLTFTNKGHPMAILLDDRAMSAPNIQSQINDSGQITFGKDSPSHPAETILKEANDLKQIMDAGSLPATLQPEPISVENISPDMGADNIAAGVRSAIIAVIAVMVFMMLYYTITGIFADMALMLNLVLVLATMAMIRGTFTLPGIAGLVLTLGMAVDANVLINERIREELHRGASLWMAIKQGYDKVFWTIFDANLTTSLTSIVLILVGSEEVKGFGVTLLIGLCIHMFTALYVTRTFMMAAVKWGVVKAIDDHSVTEYLREIFSFTWLRNGHWPFMRVITVTNFDWIGKRHYFWVVSAVITVAGVAAFFIRGDDKYDIEFRGGTQVTFQLKDPLADVVQELISLSAEPDVVKAHPEMKDLEESLKTKTINERTDTVLRLAKALGADQALAEKHAVVKGLAELLKKASDQQQLSLDDVRSMIEQLHNKEGLGELANARVYQVGNPADRRFQMQTTIANAPQKLETILPGPLSKLSEISNPRISHDNTATQVIMTLNKKQDGTYPTTDELQKKLASLADLPGLKDLANVEVLPTGKPDDHLVNATIPNKNVRVTLLEPLAERFKDVLEIKPRLSIASGNMDDVPSLIDKNVIVPITGDSPRVDQVFAKTEFQDMRPLLPLPLKDFSGGAAIMLDNIQPPESASKLSARIATIRRSSEFSNVPNREYAILPMIVVDADGKEEVAKEGDTRPMRRAVLVTADPAHRFEEGNENANTQWRIAVAGTEWKILAKSLAMEDLFEGVTSFDAVVASQAKVQALAAIVISLVLIVAYVWIRFGGIRYGYGAILSLVHDAVVALAGTVLAGVIYNYVFHRHAYLLITDFKINLTMIAAYLTVIGYSVNDTIVIFDRVREMRGKSHIPLTPKLINDAINQCFGRTIWTTFTVFIVVLIMYIWGGEGVRGFSFAMLIGVFTGAYSTLAIASPMLLATGAGKAGPRTPSPFVRKDAPRTVPELPEETDGEGDGEPDENET